MSKINLISTMMNTSGFKVTALCDNSVNLNGRSLLCCDIKGLSSDNQLGFSFPFQPCSFIKKMSAMPWKADPAGLVQSACLLCLCTNCTYLAALGSQRHHQHFIKETPSYLYCKGQAFLVLTGRFTDFPGKADILLHFVLLYCVIQHALQCVYKQC